MMTSISELARFRGCLLGLAAGDAVGTTVEFQPRGEFMPVTDMTGGGPFGLRPGEWTDDTSMALCLAASLVETGGFDPRDQIERYCRWNEDGYFSSNGRCFDIGRTTARALRRYRQHGDPFAGPSEPHVAGNGSIMRLGPVPMFFHPDEDACVTYAGESSKTTHGADECIDACRFLGGAISRALAGRPKDHVLFGRAGAFDGAPAIRAIADGSYREKAEDEIRGSGYVVDSLEAALWCFLQTTTFEAAILRAANLGDDADTTAAVCGQIAGAYYGESGIPASWLDKLAMREQIGDLASRLHARRPSAV